MINQPISIIINTDGGARGNPGPAAIGCVLHLTRPENSAAETVKISEYIGEATNNQAEYQALIAALTKVREIVGETPVKISVYLDSLLVVSQVNGIFKIKDAQLRVQYFAVMSLVQSLNGTCRFFHIPREQNSFADALVNAALDKLH